MTDNEDKNKVRPIRKGISISTEEVEEKAEPDLRMVKAIEDMLEKAKTGDLKEFVFIGLTDDNLIYSGFLGVAFDPHAMYAQIMHTATLYYDNVFYPRTEGSSRMGFGDDYEDDE
jgi:hypothetical protein